MNTEDIDEVISYNYWPVVAIEGTEFKAILYKYRKSDNSWRQKTSRRFKTPHEAWDYLRDTLAKILKFIK
jgi:hypothetical protein